MRCGTEHRYYKEQRLFVRAEILLLILLSSRVKSEDDEKRIVCYYTNWSVYRPGTAKFSPENINPYLCTHLIYAFGGFTKDDTMKPFDKYQDIDKGGYAKFTGLKTYNKNLKVLLAIGGWNEGSSRFSPMVADAGRRKKFVKNVVKFLRQNHFDGLDLDWEYPAFRDGGKPRDKDNYATFVEELRKEFEKESSKTGKPRLLLTMAVPAGIEYIDKGYDIPKLNENLDFINLLSYDYHSAYEPAVNHHSPLFPIEEDNEYNYDNELTIDYTIKHLIKSGASSGKIVVGIPTYGRSYTLFNEDANALGSPADGPGEEGSATREKGYLAYYEICEGIMSDGWTIEKPNPKAMGPYAYKKNQWVGYDDEDIVREKAKFVNNNKLGGIMFWSIDNDDFRGKCHGRPYPLIEAAKEAYLDSGRKQEGEKRQSSSSGKKRNRIPESSKSDSPSSSRDSNNGSSRKNFLTRSSSGKRSSQSPKSRTRTNSRTSNEQVPKIESSDEASENEEEASEPKKSSSKPSRTRVSSTKDRFRSRSQGDREETGRKKQEDPPSTTLKQSNAKTTTPEPPTTPDPGGDFKCEDEGFFPHPRDCKKYFWCLDSGPSGLGIVANQFTCPSGLVFNKLADSCDYPRNVYKSISRNRPATTTTTSTTNAPTTTTVSSRSINDDSEEEEDPKVIKELIDLIKKAGGIEQLEKQLALQERSSDNGSNQGTDEVTPAIISKSLYQRVLSRQANKNNLFGASSTRETSGRKSDESEVATEDNEKVDNSKRKSDGIPDGESTQTIPEEKPAPMTRSTQGYVNIRRTKPPVTAESSRVEESVKETESIPDKNQPSQSTRRSSTRPLDTTPADVPAETTTPKTRYISVNRFRSTTPTPAQETEQSITESFTVNPIVTTQNFIDVAITDGKTISIDGESGRISITPFTTDAPSTARIFTDDLSSTLKSTITLSQGSFPSVSPSTRRNPEITTLRNLISSEQSITEYPSSIATTGSSTQSTLAVVSQPRPFGYPRRTRPTTSSTVLYSTRSTPTEPTSRSKVNSSRKPGFNSFRRPSDSQLIRGSHTTVSPITMTQTSPYHPVQFGIEDSRVVEILADQSGNPQNLELIIAEPPPAVSSLSAPVSDEEATTKPNSRRRINVTQIPPLNNNYFLSTSPSRIISPEKRHQGQKYKHQTVSTIENFPLRSQSYKPAITDYDYYQDEQERIISKPHDKLYINGRGYIECLDQGNFPHPTSCRKFISCARMVNGVTIATEYTCPSKLSFDPIGGMCNWSAGLGCSDDGQ
ncbi:hypothetical protein QAD02_011899 [Eretmocerus hayati]|uniref:Uncharacterized protein n=1 Tax=Eretmocerus hayati TaxID=131215 RepID=A0ACC2NZ29_9HYME|nr:hypothetical protein QAD02_011899 [Eretmocerus hayati]